METDLAQLAVSLAKLADQIAGLVAWMKMLTGVLVGSLLVGVAILAQVARVKRWQLDHGPPLERLAAEQRARASHRRTIIARRLLRSDRRDALH